MKILNSKLLYGTAALLNAAQLVSAQTPPSLDLHLFAGVNITGIVGKIYVVQSTSDLAQADSWQSLAFVQLPATNYLFVDTSNPAEGNRFYRALLQTPPINMAYVPPTTFTMGSPTNDLDSSVNERPQTTVILTRGYWIGKFEVTQGEYVSIMHNNPSDFPGDLSRPISGMSWPDATNYCWKLTQQELAAGRILPGSRYRLPTEAEWECAARGQNPTLVT